MDLLALGSVPNFRPGFSHKIVISPALTSLIFCCSLQDKKKKKSGRRPGDESCSNNGHGGGSSGAVGIGGSHGVNNVDRARASRSRGVAALPPLGSPPIVSSTVPLNSAAPAISPQAVNVESRFDEVASKLVSNFDPYFCVPI